MSSSPRHRRSESWLSRILGGPHQSSPSPPRSDCSHRSTAAEAPVATELPTYAETATQTESESLEHFLQRVAEARKLIRSSIEKVEDPPIPKRRKTVPATDVYQVPVVPRPPEAVQVVKPAAVEIQAEKNAQRIEEKPPMQHEVKGEDVVALPASSAEDRADMPDSSPEAESPHFQSPANIPLPFSPPRAPTAPAPSPQSSSASSPSVAFAKEKSVTFGTHPLPAAARPVASSFFVQQPVSADDFIEDSGFLGGEDDDDSEGNDHEEEPKPLFTSGSLFATAPSTANTSLFGSSMFSSGSAQKEAPKTLFHPVKDTQSAVSMFGNPAQAPVFAPSTSLFGGTRPLFSSGSSLFSDQKPNAVSPFAGSSPPPLATTPPAPGSLFASATPAPGTLFASTTPAPGSLFASATPAPEKSPFAPSQNTTSQFAQVSTVQTVQITERSTFGQSPFRTAPEPSVQPASTSPFGKPFQPSPFPQWPTASVPAEKDKSQEAPAPAAQPSPSSMTFSNPIFTFNPPPAASPFSEQPTVFISSPASSGFFLAPPTNTPTDPTPPSP